MLELPRSPLGRHDFHFLAVRRFRRDRIRGVLPAGRCRAFQVQLLVFASLFFYGYGQPELLALLAVAVFGTYLFLLLALRNRKVWLPVGIAFNLALLAFFKYKLLFIDPASPSLVGLRAA